MDLNQFKLEIVTLKETHSVSIHSKNPETIIDELTLALNEGFIKLNVSNSPELQNIVIIPREKIECLKVSQLKEIVNEKTY